MVYGFGRGCELRGRRKLVWRVERVYESRSMFERESMGQSVVVESHGFFIRDTKLPPLRLYATMCERLELAISKLNRQQALRWGELFA